ncbi:hypothetical protein DL767_011214 [Monosporascus sp. MG133]|nr:hypothetical protein DL767_011214 [Monosporascus sp. MG133]
MDPLSTTASIIAILQLSSDVVKYIIGATGATKDRRRLREEILACESVLLQLQDHADDADEGTKWWEKIRALEGPDKPLYRLGIALEAVMAKLEPKKSLDKALSVLKWPFDEKEVEKLISAMQREKSLLQLAMTNECRELIREVKKSSGENKELLMELIQTIKDNATEDMGQFTKLNTILVGIQESQGDLKDYAGELRDQRVNLEQRTILDWIPTINYAPQQSDIINRRQPGTGQWLLDSAKYQDWLKNDKQTLFCPGIPGAGKTILTSIVVENLMARFENDKNIGVAYFYCNFRQQDDQKAEDILGNLLKQLAQGRSPLPEIVVSLYNSHKDKQTRPSFDEISRVLQSVAALYSRVFIVVDALDECQTTGGCRTKLLSELFSLQAKYGTNLFATSRYIPEITEMFSKSISLEIRASVEDVRRYVDAHISHLPSFVGRNPELQKEIQTGIVKAIDGMFLLAKLHLNSLIGKRSPKAVRAALTKLPTGSEAYDHAYENAMERIESQVSDQEELAKQVLSWITCARRPLTISELQCALAVEVGEAELDEENLPQIGDMLSAFESGACQSDDEFEERLRSNPLYDYAAHNWGHHARKDINLSQMVFGFLGSKAKVKALNQALMVVKWWFGHSGYSQEYPRRITGLHLAAYFGVENLARFLLGSNGPDLKDSYGRTPLSWAAEKGYKAVVKLLLAAEGVEADSKDDYGRTPLSWAAENGHEAVVKLLLAEGVEADSKDKYGRTPLSWAAENGHQAVLKLLLAEGVKADSKDVDGRTPLSWAAENGHEAVVKLLLAEGVEADSKDDDGRTPLSWAAENGHEAVVKLLLTTDGVKPDSKDGFSRIPLSYAFEKGHKRSLSC